MNRRQARKADQKHYLYGGYYSKNPMPYRLIRMKTREVKAALRRAYKKGVYRGIESKRNSRHRQIRSSHLAEVIKVQKLEYRPKVVEGKINGTGWPIDGHALMLSSWDYDNHDSWHLDLWKDEDDPAVMETMFITETAADMCLYDTLEEFAKHWDDWEAQAVFCIPLENVEVLKVLQEEEKNW